MAIFATHNESSFQVGDLVRVHIQDQAARRRESVFEGYVLGIRGGAENRSILVRRVGVARIGIERIFPLASPLVSKIEVKQKLGEGTRRAKLYFLRGQPKSAFEEIARRSGRKGKVQVKTKSRVRKRARRQKRVTRAKRKS